LAGKALRDVFGLLITISRALEHFVRVSAGKFYESIGCHDPDDQNTKNIHHNHPYKLQILAFGLIHLQAKLSVFTYHYLPSRDVIKSKIFARTYILTVFTTFMPYGDTICKYQKHRFTHYIGVLTWPISNSQTGIITGKGNIRRFYILGWKEYSFFARDMVVVCSLS
jgi:hypothetical protein